MPLSNGTKGMFDNMVSLARVLMLAEGIPVEEVNKASYFDLAWAVRDYDQDVAQRVRTLVADARRITRVPY